jgi:hypothetical protein
MTPCDAATPDTPMRRDSAAGEFVAPALTRNPADPDPIPAAFHNTVVLHNIWRNGHKGMEFAGLSSERNDRP